VTIYPGLIDEKPIVLPSDPKEWSPSFTIATYPLTDLPYPIPASVFGNSPVRVGLIASGTGPSATAEVDWIQLEVTYLEACQ
jgi:hypothetical protein